MVSGQGPAASNPPAASWNEMPEMRAPAPNPSTSPSALAFHGRTTPSTAPMSNDDAEIAPQKREAPIVRPSVQGPRPTARLEPDSRGFRGRCVARAIERAEATSRCLRWRAALRHHRRRPVDRGHSRDLLSPRASVVLLQARVLLLDRRPDLLLLGRGAVLRNPGERVARMLDVGDRVLLLLR